MKTPDFAYRPSFRLNLPTVGVVAILLSLITACGGSSGGPASPSTNPGASTVSLTISAASNEVYAGGAPVSLNVSKSQGSGTVNWSLNNTSLGSLSASSGDTIQYTPPSLQNLGGANSVTITASIGSVSQSLTLPIQSRARIEFVAGDIGGMGNIDGVGAGARFNLPKNLVVDKDGTIFVCDTGNGLIRKITTAGVVSTMAVFDSPRALTVDRDGKLYVIDGKSNLIRSITPQGVISTLSTQIALKAKAELKDLAVDTLGNLYVMENELIHRITKSGELSVFAGKSNELGFSDGKGIAARFTSLDGIVVDKENNLFVLDDIAIRKVTPDGQVTTLDIAPTSYKGGSIAIDPAGNLYVTNFRFDTTYGGLGITLRRLGKNGDANFLDVRGKQLTKGSTKIAIGDNGKIVLADTGNHRVMTMNVQGNYAEASSFVGLEARADYSGQFISIFGVPVPINDAIRFYFPPMLVAANGELLIDETDTGLVADTQGYFYVISVDSFLSPYNPRPAIFRMAASGAKGVLISFDNSDAPIVLALDAQDRLYFASTTAVYKFSSESGAVLIAGHAKLSGYIDANSTTARFGKINGLHVSRDGSIYLTDKNVLRKIDVSGNVTTIAGRYGEAGSMDGTSATARFGLPRSITSDTAGNIYLVDSEMNGDSRYDFNFNIGKNHIVRRISPTGVVTTIAGVAGKFGIGLNTFPNTLGRINDIQFVAPNTLYISSEYSVLKMNLTN